MDYPTHHDFDMPDGSVKFGPAKIKIMQDPHADCPWEDMDGLAPIYVWGDRFDNYHGERYGDPMNPWDHIDASKVSRNWRKIAEIFDTTEEAHDQEARDRAEYEGYGLSEARRDVFIDAFRDMVSYGRKADAADVVVELWKLAKVNAKHFTGHGYSQGDWHEGVIAHTPEFLKAVGLNYPDTRDAEDIARDMKGDTELYGAWAYGDVYGYEIQGPKGETLDSCFGYYGVPYGHNPAGEGKWDVLDYGVAEALSGIAPSEAAKARKNARKAIAKLRKLLAELGDMSTESTPAALGVVEQAIAKKRAKICKLRRRASGWQQVEIAVKRAA